MKLSLLAIQLVGLLAICSSFVGCSLTDGELRARDLRATPRYTEAAEEMSRTVNLAIAALQANSLSDTIRSSPDGTSEMQVRVEGTKARSSELYLESLSRLTRMRKKYVNLSLDDYLVRAGAFKNRASTKQDFVALELIRQHLDQRKHSTCDIQRDFLWSARKIE